MSICCVRVSPPPFPRVGSEAEGLQAEDSVKLSGEMVFGCAFGKFIVWNELVELEPYSQLYLRKYLSTHTHICNSRSRV